MAARIHPPPRSLRSGACRRMHGVGQVVSRKDTRVNDGFNFYMVRARRRMTQRANFAIRSITSSSSAAAETVYLAHDWRPWRMFRSTWRADETRETPTGRILAPVESWITISHQSLGVTCSQTAVTPLARAVNRNALRPFHPAQLHHDCNASCNAGRMRDLHLRHRWVTVICDSRGRRASSDKREPFTLIQLSVNSATANKASRFSMLATRTWTELPHEPHVPRSLSSVHGLVLP